MNMSKAELALVFGSAILGGILVGGLFGLILAVVNVLVDVAVTSFGFIVMCALVGGVIAAIAYGTIARLNTQNEGYNYEHRSPPRRFRSAERQTEGVNTTNVAAASSAGGGYLEEADREDEEWDGVIRY